MGWATEAGEGSGGLLRPGEAARDESAIRGRGADDGSQTEEGGDGAGGTDCSGQNEGRIMRRIVPPPPPHTHAPPTPHTTRTPPSTTARTIGPRLPTNRAP